MDIKLIFLNLLRDGISSWGYIILEFISYRVKKIIMYLDLKLEVYLKSRENLW